MAAAEKVVPFNPDKWIKSRLDDLQSEMFESGAQHRMFMEDLLEAHKEMQEQIGNLQSQLSFLKTKLDKLPETKGNESLAVKIEQIQKQVKEMGGPKKIIRDQNGFITGVRAMTAEEMMKEAKEGE